MAAISMTDEQQAAVDACRRGVRRLKIEALAGTGKTTVLAEIAKTVKTMDPMTRVLYTAFNKSVVEDVQVRIGRFADCSTVHSLAFRSIGTDLVRKKMADSPRRVRAQLGAARLGIDDDLVLRSTLTTGEVKRIRLSPSRQFSLATRAVNQFCNSVDTSLGRQHVQTTIWSPESSSSVELSNSGREAVADYASRLWDALRDADSFDFPFEHEHYMKMWHLMQPELPWDVILFDEAQDADPLMRDVVERHPGRVIWCGDRFQSIYSWRGAVNAMELVDADATMYLTQSFRFGEAIAEQANCLLVPLGGRPIRGNRSIESVVGQVDLPDAELFNLNVTALLRFVELVGQSIPAHINIDMAGLERLMSALLQLLSGEQSSHPELVDFENIAQLEAWLNDPDLIPGEFELTIRRLLKFQGSTIDVQRTLEWLQELNSVVVGIRKEGSQTEGRLLSTVHRVKGLQFNRVVVGDDFSDLRSDWLSSPAHRERWHVAYVAITRAISQLSHGFTIDSQSFSPVQPHLAHLAESRLIVEKVDTNVKSDSGVTSGLRIIETSDFVVKVVGTSHYQTAIEQALSGLIREDKGWRTRARLIRDVSNSFDANAVRIEIADVVVGYLPKQYAEVVAPQLSDEGFNCSAMINGGHHTSNGRANFGVILAVAWVHS